VLQGVGTRVPREEGIRDIMLKSKMVRGIAIFVWSAVVGFILATSGNGCGTPDETSPGGTLVCEGERQELQTCFDDCECSARLVCRPCITPDAGPCNVLYCRADDARCNNGVVTCPVSPGLPCEGVPLCQTPR